MFRARIVREGTVLTIRQQNKSLNRLIKKGEKVMIGWNERDNSVV